MSILIGLGHKARQGKDEAVKTIIEARGLDSSWAPADYEKLNVRPGCGYDIRRYAFADELKYEMHGALCHPFDPFWALYSELVKAKPLTFLPYSQLPKPDSFGATRFEKLQFFERNRNVLRPLAQVYGTEYRRNQDVNYWVIKLAARIAEDKPQFALIPDMRFPNEAFFVQANGGYTVKMVRHGFVDLNIDSSHPSENALNDFPFHVVVTVPDGHLDELKRDAIELFDMIVEWQKVPEYKTEDFTEKAMEAA